MRTLVRALFAVLDARTAGAFSREYQLINRTQWQSPQSIVELQIARLRDLLDHAERHVPFYQQHFADYGVHAADLHDLSDLRRFPLLTKAEVLANNESLIAETGRRDIVRKATGGSTGERVVFYRSAEGMARNFAHVLRNYGWAGLTLGQPHAFLWGAHFDLRAQQRLSNRLINVCLSQHWLDAFHMNPDSLTAYYERLRRWRPQLLSSYVTAATTLADFIKDEGLVPLDLGAIATTAETLFPEHRERLTATLATEVYDRFGCREIGNTAHECPAHAGLHINAEHVVVELVDESGDPVPPGSEGEIVYTSLGNSAFPLIRYRVGDYGVAGDEGTCGCGRGLPRLRKVRGRMSDMLVAPDGTKIHGEFFSHLFYAAANVREFRVLQETMNSVTIWVRPQGGALPVEQRRAIEAGLRRVFGTDVRMTIDVVDAIPRSESGKHRFTESRVTAGAA